MGFFDKLKIGGEEKKVKKETALKTTVKTKPVKKNEKEEIGVVEEKVEKKEKLPKKSEESDFEGELAIDVYETGADFVIQSTIAGIKAEDLDITIENDIVTVRGSREKQTSEETKKYYYQECYWGAFSRQVILPEEVDGSKAEAVIKDGVLTLKIPKVIKVQKRKIVIKQD